MIKPKQSFSKKELSIQQYISGLRDGNVSILGRAITLVESTRISHQ